MSLTLSYLVWGKQIMQKLIKKFELTTNKNINLTTRLTPNSKGRTFSFAALLFTLMLFSVLFISLFNNSSFFASADTVTANNWATLNGFVTAPGVTERTILLANDITVTTGTLTIPAGRDITLGSSTGEVFQLIGVSGQATITVAAGGNTAA
jgi:hypothetical protein